MKKWILPALSAALVLVMAVVMIGQIRRAQAAERSLKEAAVAAVSDAAEDLQSVVIAMDKLPLTSSAGQRASMLHDILLASNRARRSLELLPASPDEMAPILAYLTRLSSGAGLVLQHLATGTPVTEGEIEALTSTRSGLALLHAELQLAREDLLAGEPIDSLPASQVTLPPTLQETTAYKALPPGEITSGQALLAAREFVGEDRAIRVSPAPDISGSLPAYGVTVQTSDLQLNVEVTKRGGKVLMMSPETAAFSMEKSVEECQSSAAAFLASRGFITMTPTWYQLYSGMCVMTFVHEQEGALIWPDRVVVQVRMDTAEVVGLEARSYWKNHTPRRIGSPAVTLAQARTALAPQAEELGARLALLPAGGQERLCWQFTLRYDGEHYISFIDAQTGQELLLEKVMQLEYGAIPA